MFRLCSCAVLCLLVATPSARADTILFGTPGLGSNAFPFGGGAFPTASDRYQQVYDNALFLAQVSGPISITGITFFNTLAEGVEIFAPNIYTFDLSTSANPVNGLDTVNLQNNVGGDNALFGSYPLAGPMPSPSFSFSGSPFVYDPANGDLLVDITTAVSNYPGLLSFADFMVTPTFGSDSSNAHNYGSLFPSTGLVTQFTFTEQVVSSVPEPASVILLGTGLAGCIGYARRRRRARAAV